ncbi:unnamed protein product [Symbiodinium sp. CCMP2592]|nr:unnamed protein product [Symbiodinium sp. CCMP2592]
MVWTSPSPAKRRVDLESPTGTSLLSMSTPGTPGTGHTVSPGDLPSGRKQLNDVVSRAIANRKHSGGIILLGDASRDDDAGDGGDEGPAAAEEAAEDDPAPAADSKVPKTRSELQKLRENFANTMHLCLHFYADRSLQQQMRLVSTACKPIRDSYHQSLVDQKSQASTMKFQATRAAAGWFDVVRDTLHLIHEREALQRFNVTTSVSTSILEEDDDLAKEPWFLEESELVDTFWKLLVELASARSWSQVQFSTIQPCALAIALSPDNGPNSLAQKLLHEQRDTWNAVLKAERSAASDSKLDPGVRSALNQVLCDLGWNRLQVSREAMLECTAANWKVSDQRVLETARCLFAGQAQTKYHLEDLFAHLVSVARASNLPTFFTVDRDPSNRSPIWLFNSKFDKCDWLRHQVKVIHPLLVPPDLRGYGIVLQKTGPPQELVPAALRAGIFLTVKQIKELQGHYHFAIPTKGSGSGKKGNVVKRDLAKALLKFFFGESMDERESERLLSSLMGQQWDRQGKGSPHASELVAAFKSLDATDQPDFCKLAAVAADEVKLKESRAARVDMQAVHASPAFETPRVLSKLLPYGPGFACRFNRRQWSHAVTWHGPRRQLSEEDALKECVDACWKEVRSKRALADFQTEPTMQEISDVVSSFDKATGYKTPPFADPNPSAAGSPAVSSQKSTSAMQFSPASPRVAKPSESEAPPKLPAIKSRKQSKGPTDEPMPKRARGRGRGRGA